MTPTFKLKSSSTDPGDKRCVATWSVGDELVISSFDDSADAFAVNKLINAAYKAGGEDKHEELSIKIAALLNNK